MIAGPKGKKACEFLLDVAKFFSVAIEYMCAWFPSFTTQQTYGDSFGVLSIWPFVQDYFYIFTLISFFPILNGIFSSSTVFN